MIKVVWILHFSNAEIRKKQHVRVPLWEKIARKIMHLPQAITPDYAVWNSNAIHEFESFHDVELHVIAPVAKVNKKLLEFEIRGIHYHFYRSQGSSFADHLIEAVFNKTDKEFKKNRKVISSIINRVRPEIVHMFGAENPYYSISLLDVPQTIPTILQLTTLISDPDIIAKYPKAAESWLYRGDIEKKLINHTIYVATTATKFINIIRRDIKPNVKILNLTLALAERVNLDERETVFDFVYFASSISKAFDLALEGFASAHKINSNITLDVVGGYQEDEKAKYDRIIAELGLSKAITFEGQLPTHDDVLTQIRKSKIALLPLRTDLTSGTIREAISNGLPVVTTDTGELGTRRLNSLAECVLMSETGDGNALAQNMMRVLNDDFLADRLRNNAVNFALSTKTNTDIAKEYLDVYYQILDGKDPSK